MPAHVGPLLPTANIRNTTTNVNLLQDMYLFKRFVSSLRKELIVLPLGMRDETPGGVGKTVRWQFWNNPAANTTPLTEGTDRTDSVALATTKAEATLQQFGDFFEIADFLETTGINGTMTGFVDGAAYQARLSIEDLILVEFQATTQIQDVGTALAVEDLRTGSAGLKENDAKPHRGTPGGAYFCFLGSVESTHDMMGEGAPPWFQVRSQDFQAALTQPFNGSTAASAVYDVYVKMSNNLKAAAGDDLNYLIADDSFGVTSINSNLANPRLIIKTPAQQGGASPLEMRGTVGWKINFATKLFDSNRIREILSDQT